VVTATVRGALRRLISTLHGNDTKGEDEQRQPLVDRELLAKHKD